MKDLVADPAEIDRILGAGAARAAAIAEPILARTYEIVGLIRVALNLGAAPEVSAEPALEAQASVNGTAGPAHPRRSAGSA